MKRVSIRQAIDRVTNITPEDLRSYNNLIYWAKEAEKKIDSMYDQKYKSFVDTVTDAEISLPPDCYKIYNVFYGDLTDQIFNYFGRNMVTTPLNVADVTDDFGSWISTMDETYNIYPTLWAEQNGSIQFPPSEEGKQYTLVYRYIDTDSQGYWMINESHVIAISNYVEYMYERTYIIRKGRAVQLVRNGDMALMQDLRSEYQREMRNARFLDSRNKPLD